MLTETEITEELRQTFELAASGLELKRDPLAHVRRATTRRARYVAIGATGAVAAGVAGMTLFSGTTRPPSVTRGPGSSAPTAEVALDGPVMKLAGFKIKTPAGSKLSGTMSNHVSTADATIRAWLVRGEDPTAEWSDVEHLEIDSHPAEMARVEGDLILSITLPAADDGPSRYIVLHGTNTDRDTLLAMAESVFEPPME